MHSEELTKLVAAAVISHHFCHLLLTDPEQALESGYNGTTFDLTTRERQLVLTIQATSLTEFARQLSDGRFGNGHKGQGKAHRNGTLPLLDRDVVMPDPVLAVEQAVSLYEAACLEGMADSQLIGAQNSAGYVDTPIPALKTKT